MLEELKERVLESNLALKRHNLITFTWGNASAIDRATGLIVIKPSGVAYEELRAERMIVIDLNGAVVEGALRPSSDAPTHIELYKRFPAIGGVVHTHSTHATAFAQAERDLPCYGTTHADYYYGPVPCARALTADEINGAYERATGEVIAECFEARGIDPLAVPAALARKHGPFCWGATVEKAVESAVVLEECARMAMLTEALNPSVLPADAAISDKHYFRKHGANAYYGQGAAK